MSLKAISSDTAELVNSLSQNIQGEVRSDEMSKTLWSTDASIYQINPVAVVLPKSKDDVISVVETCAKYGVPVLPLSLIHI